MQYKSQMKAPSRVYRVGLCIMALLLANAGLQAESSDLNSNSPFLPPGHGEKAPAPAKPKPVTNGPISRQVEFRGIIQIGNNYKFSLFNKNEQKSYWFRKDQVIEGIRVQSFDADSMTVTVNMGGRSERITLLSATDSPIPVATSNPTSANQTPPGNQPNKAAANSSPNQNNRRQVVPRRRVILPKK
ncbi:MAG: hypothetical protein AAGC73_03335 [Verrucomicrobiota bacterium]